MKNIFKFLVLVLVVLVLSQACAYASHVGVIDLKKAWNKYEKAAKADQELNKKEVNLENYLIDKKRKIADGKTPLERKNLEDKYAKEFKEKFSKIEKWYKDEQEKLDANMMESIKKIAAKKKISVVFIKNAVVLGGVDITDDVIKLLNK